MMGRGTHKTMAMLCMLMAFGVRAQTSCSFQVKPTPDDRQAVWQGFTQGVDVLGCFRVLAVPEISEMALRHVATIAAELLDQDEDGHVDDVRVKQALSECDAVMPVFERPGSRAERRFFRRYQGEGVAAVLYADEIAPERTGQWGWDATVEEVLHTLHMGAYVRLFPEAFGLPPHSSLLTEAMDVARGGQWRVTPRRYPAEAWYHYDDRTCDYGCMAIEYLYWATVTEMGLLNDPRIAEGIADEWQWTTAEGLQSGDVLVHALLHDERFNLPICAPDGRYCPPSGVLSDPE
ncbi:MAG TPA: hypothetical protein DHV07_04710 [Flavobacteriales bacterium]|nr:hypothetical protein [Flavobacteriales bacterium]